MKVYCLIHSHEHGVVPYLHHHGHNALADLASIIMEDVDAWLPEDGPNYSRIRAFLGRSDVLGAMRAYNEANIRGNRRLDLTIENVED